jgi:hypothetical protein
MNRILTGASAALLAFTLGSANATADNPGAEEALAGSTEIAIPPGDVQVGVGVVCDTGDQVKRFAALSDQEGDVALAIRTVNNEADNPAACAQVVAAFVRGKDIGEVHRDHDSLAVAEITILAIPEGDQWQFVSPVKQYTAFPVTGFEI